MGGGARFVGSSYSNDENTSKNSSRVLFDASIGYDFAAIDQKYEGLHLQVNATNLFDAARPCAPPATAIAIRAAPLSARCAITGKRHDNSRA
ncbi:hypothetical protein T190_20300 [Sinorhizobium meliloti CCBAU 01290]|nr:hypothetical protein T190_20300 [Sinorhizobium meliloti CCBAU 01290]